MTHAPERTQAPNLLRALGLAVTCWGLTLGVSVMLGVLVTFHELVSPFTVPDVVAVLGQVVAGLALFLGWSWGYRLGWIVSGYLCVLGTFLMVAPSPEYSEPTSSLDQRCLGGCTWPQALCSFWVWWPRPASGGTTIALALRDSPSSEALRILSPRPRVALSRKRHLPQSDQNA
jgi:hypothetical protein